MTAKLQRATVPNKIAKLYEYYENVHTIHALFRVKAFSRLLGKYACLFSERT